MRYLRHGLQVHTPSKRASSGSQQDSETPEAKADDTQQRVKTEKTQENEDSEKRAKNDKDRETIKMIINSIDQIMRSTKVVIVTSILSTFVTTFYLMPTVSNLVLNSMGKMRKQMERDFGIIQRGGDIDVMCPACEKNVNVRISGVGIKISEENIGQR